MASTLHMTLRGQEGPSVLKPAAFFVRSVEEASGFLFIQGMGSDPHYDRLGLELFVQRLDVDSL